ncbi:glycosyltransferase family 39 protein [Exidia glandulosa HHB12029]|uniref:Dolichyl-phosphate-mannose--protein mannosyltransferase n=1 Tax=Exidia glandulosa HHB12029 TaxID=1314781 RepID=A0A165EP81_EXIGL|nr:glycosyltransferase family 39 protein [Exidia glandulosa HHB12029]
MPEDKARRRVVRAHNAPEHDQGISDHGYPAEEERDVYEKMRLSKPVPVGTRRRVPPPATNIQEALRQNMEHIIPAIYTLLSCWTRFHDIGKSNYVVWDEAHFGKFGSHYLKREFYFDVHPPLGKMLVGLVGGLAGYTGNFDFKSGAQYPDDVPYTAMRVMLSIFGVLMVPLAWYTAREMGMGHRASHIVTIMTLCDLAWLCISRFILLDAMLLFFTFLVIFCLTKFHSERFEPFEPDWWLWLALTGISIGCVCSVKWVGFFATAVVGLYTIEDLWDKFGDLRMPVRTYFYHWVARACCLIVLPFIVYATCFKIHFIVLNHSGPGDAQMPSLFQANLVGNDFGRNPVEAAFGSRVTLKNMGYGGGLLHSHVQSFPTGSKQQQVTCYHYKDDNNHWNIAPPWNEPAVDLQGPIRFLQDNDVIRLQHSSTKRNLHSHAVPAPVTKLANEVSCYGNETVGDNHDHWIVEVVDDLKQGRRSNVKRIHSLTTRLRFKHKRFGCYLRAANVILPQWGFKQVEVSCEKDTSPSDTHTYWNIENHWNDRLPMADRSHSSSPFFRDFWHLNVAMMTSNNALVPDPDKEDILASKPFDWPLMHLGLRMCGWGDHQLKYYLLGNPIVWWSGAASLVLSVIALLVYALRWQRKYADFEPAELDKYLFMNKLSLLGWALHFGPFVIMGRVTYVHHYLPALYFAVLSFGALLDHFVFSSRRLNARAKWTVFGLIVFAVVDTFWWFKGIAFGIDGPIGEHKGLQWRKSWNIY